MRLIHKGDSVASRQMQVFSVDEAVACAHDVVHHDPKTPRDHAWIPNGPEAADAGVLALSGEINALPAAFRSSIANADESGSLISDDRLQGLAELIQNADDLGASRAELTVDETRSQLMFRHNGAGLTLHDVLALAIPWLSMKFTDADQLGRFGIGLKTLHSLSDTLEVHQGHFRIRYEGHDLSPTTGAFFWPTSWQGTDETTFVIPFEAGATNPEAVMSWLNQWSDAGLVFLRNLRSVTYLSADGSEHVSLHVDREPPHRITTPHGELDRHQVTAADSRQWVVYSRKVPIPKGQRRARKAQAEHTPVAIAFLLTGSEPGYLHVGLPVRTVGLPFRLLAQFDPLASRRDISNNAWNHSLIKPLSELWLDATLDHFSRQPAAAWAAVPLDDMLDADDRTLGELRTQIEQHFMADGRMALADALELPFLDELYGLDDLAYEDRELAGLLQSDDVRAVSKKPAVVAPDVRSTDEHWRVVLDQLREIGAKSPTVVTVEDALVLLEDTERPLDFVADLVAAALEYDDGYLYYSLDEYPCLILDSGDRLAPEYTGGLDVLVPLETGALWKVLGLGHRLDPAYQSRPAWPVIKQWLEDERRLTTDASDHGALKALASADDVLEPALSDEQAVALRAAFESLAPAERQALGPGVGRSVRLDAATYDTSGKRVSTTARPCDAYIIEAEAFGWSAAAARTPGLVWLDRKFTALLRSESGRDGVGAQRLFGLLGAERTPRLTVHPQRHQRFALGPPGVRFGATDSPPRRTRQLSELSATYTVDDRVSPDLDAVLREIADERQPKERIRRASAVLNTLSRAWDRLGSQARVQAAKDYGSWLPQGEVDAWWVAQAASIPWLTSGTGAAASPQQLRIRTSVSEAFFGSDPAQYLSEEFDAVANREVLDALGILGEPRQDQLVERLRALRREVPNDPVAAADGAAPIYRALGSQVAVEGTLRRGAAANLKIIRSEFGKGDGLVATNVGWRRPHVTLSGPALFGDLFPFVPAVPGAEPLWEALNIRRPGPTEARQVLLDLREQWRQSKLSSGWTLIMLEALRILARAPLEETAHLKRGSVWIGNKWTTERPVFAVANPLLAEGLADQIPMWQPGGTLAQLEALIDQYGLTRINTSHAKVGWPERAEFDHDLTSVFQSAVRHLQADLALSDAASEASITLSWDQLAQFDVSVLSGLQLSLPGVVDGRELTFATRAWVDTASSTLYITEREALETATSGAFALATLFAADPRTIAHAWLAAWATAKEGLQVEAVRTAASREAEQKREREARDRAAEADARLRALAERSSKRRSKTTSGVHRADSAPTNTDVRTPEPQAKQPRTLVDLSTLTITNPAGEIVEGPADSRNRTSPIAASPTPRLREPDRSKSSRSTSAGASPRNYTPEELEARGHEICRRVLGLDLEEIADIRKQHNVGADAVDKLDNFYEYKVHAGTIPNQIRLEPSEIERARTTDGFFLVLIGNLESGSGSPEVRIITNPLDQLVLKPTTSVQYTGALSAKALVYRFTPEAPDQIASEEPSALAQ